MIERTIPWWWPQTDWLALADIIDELGQSGDLDTDACYGAPKAVELEDEWEGWEIRLLSEPDQDFSINDYESDGRVEWVRIDPDTRKAARPDGFDDRAREIEWDYPSVLWWQPWEELTDPADIDAEVPRIRELARFGFQGLGVELVAPWGEVSAQWVWGIEWDAGSGPNNYAEDVYREQLNELAHDVRGLAEATRRPKPEPATA